MNGYMWFYKGTSGTVFAVDSFSAHIEAIKATKAPKSKQSLITVVLCEKEGKQITHSTSSI